MFSAEEFLLSLFQSAVKAASAEQCLPSFLPLNFDTNNRTIVVGAGKAAASMAQICEQHWEKHAQTLSGLVITRYKHGADCNHIEVIEAGHPIPDQAGLAAAKKIQQLVTGLSKNDLVVCLLSGGGSALLTAPAENISLEVKRRINNALLKSGSTIAEVNCVRKHLSALKGGQLAALCAPARILNLMISDVPGDDASVIASGPTVADPTTCASALEIINNYHIPLPDAIRSQLESGHLETPKPGDAAFDHTETHIIATTHDALKAAATLARQQKIEPLILGDLQGEARELAQEHARLAIQIKQGLHTIKPPCVILSGGETTVTVRGNGQGGRNTEYLLALALALNEQPHIYALAADTDGIDGSETNAGALLKPNSLQRAAKLGLNATSILNNNDAYPFFSQLDDLIETGPTRTNVNDLRAILILPDSC